MTNANHTPGPWEDNGDGLIYGQCSGDDDMEEAPLVADVCNVASDYTDQERANARLIAAAPSLLAACQMVVDRWERGDLAEAARACRDALAEAG
jgi:enoyl-CoA hydratase/carnithine racemase